MLTGSRVLYIVSSSFNIISDAPGMISTYCPPSKDAEDILAIESSGIEILSSKFSSTIARKDCLSSLFDDTSPTFIPAITTSSPTFNPPICPNSAFMYLPFF